MEKTMPQSRGRGATLVAAAVAIQDLIRALYATNMIFVLPLVIVLLAIALLLALTALVAPIAPFVYPLF